MTDLDVVSHTDVVLTVEVGDRRFELHVMWLRDACRCSQCRRLSSNERLLDSESIPPDITISAVSHAPNLLSVHTSDGHDIRLSTTWLIEHLTSADAHDDPARGHSLWDAATAGCVERFDVDVLERSETRRTWLDCLHSDGITLVRHRVGEQALRDVATSIGPIRATNYGDVWTVDATIEPVTAVDSERALRAHTDLPYLDDPPGVQLMMVENDGVEGGDSTFVDGFAVAEHVRRTDPDAWRLLTTIEFSYPFVRDDIEMHGRAPLIGRRSNGEYAMIRRAPDLVGVPFVSADDTPALYRAAGLWNGLLDGGQFEQQVRVGAGDVIVWDNHRVLHGRTGFQLGSAGRRVLRGCYVDMDHLRNERALAARTAYG